MSLRISGRFNSGDKSGGFNMTPVIDIVFLLIIFFLVVCKFIEAENFPVSVPEGCEFAQNNPEPGVQLTTVTIMKTAEGEVDFAVGPEKIPVSSNTEIVDKLTELIDVCLKEVPLERRIVTLRVDRDVCFADAQYALAGIAASSAKDIQLAVLKDKHTDPE